MKYAIKITESFVRSVVVEADSYEEAQDKVANAYYDGWLVLHPDNSAFDIELNDDTENYIEIFGKKEFEEMEETDGLRRRD